MNGQSKFTIRSLYSCNKVSCGDSLGSKIMNLSSESEEFCKYNIFKLISAIWNAWVCTICKYLSRRPVPTLVDPCTCKPCDCEECTKFAKKYDSNSIEHRVLWENESHDDLSLNNLKCKKVSPCNYSNCHAGDVGQSDSCQYSACSCATCLQHCLSFPGIKMINSLHKSCLSNSCSLRCASGGDMVGNPTEKHHNVYTAIVQNHQLIPKTVDFTNARVCKCTFCECLTCPYQGKASFAGSQETISLVKKKLENEWKRKSMERKYDFELPRCGPKITISKVGDVRNPENYMKCTKDATGHAGTCHCSIKEILNNLYEHEIEMKEHNNKVLNEQLYKNNDYCTVANVETNTEYKTEEKSTETGSNHQCVENKVKNYEYTLKIDITAPDLDNISNHSTKQKIKKISQNKIKEQAQKVMVDIINDITRNTLTDQPKQTSIVDLTNNNKVDDYIISCITPIHHTIAHSTAKTAEVNESKLPSKDGSSLQFQDMEKLDKLRVQEPCARRVSHHTVSLKWKLPKAIEGVMGYEILVDGKSIETIVNPRRCMTVISCLPPVQRLLITIRTITKTDLKCLPCTTIRYHPRDNKYICV